MELGETVCIPNGAPKCELCPLQKLCRAGQNGSAQRFPVKAPLKARRQEERTVLLLRCGDRYAIRRRPKSGLLAGLWEFPNESGSQGRAALLARFPQALSIADCGRATHIFTHVEWHMQGFLVELPEELPDFLWETPQAIRERYSVPTALKAYLKQI